jgi:hypothetical protein
MPMKRELYPSDWAGIASRVKRRADYRCEECGAECRRPGERMKDRWPDEGHRRTLTVSHRDHDPANCADENLRALCAPCHCRYDANTRRKRGQIEA